MNAAQSIHPGQSSAHRIRVRSRFSLDQVIVEVEDTGCGIREEQKKFIFNPFYTTKHQQGGSGLGLSICQELVGEYKGRMDFRSQEGQGSQFRVILPVTRPIPTLFFEDAKRQRLPNPHLRARVLVVDDNVELLESVAAILEPFHEVTIESEPRVILRDLQQGRRFDCILCDLMMPKMSGIDFYRRVQIISADQAARFVFMTGGSFTAETDQFLSKIRVPYREKPISVQDLRLVIEDVMLKSPQIETFYEGPSPEL
jgi:CheY-like chemotaxis protein